VRGRTVHTAESRDRAEGTHFPLSLDTAGRGSRAAVLHAFETRRLGLPINGGEL